MKLACDHIVNDLGLEILIGDRDCDLINAWSLDLRQRNTFKQIDSKTDNFTSLKRNVLIRPIIGTISKCRFRRGIRAPISVVLDNRLIVRADDLALRDEDLRNLGESHRAARAVFDSEICIE